MAENDNEIEQKQRQTQENDLKFDLVDRYQNSHQLSYI